MDKDFNTKKEEVITFNKNNVYVGISPKNYGRTYFANRPFKKEDVVMKGFGKKIDHQTAHISVQIEKDVHYLGTKWTCVYWNHSCNPNTYIHTRQDGFPNLVADRNIEKDEEITYAYWMTEFEWGKNADENYIECKCGERNCMSKILSFSQLPRKKQLELVNLGKCSKYLYKQCK